MSACCEDKDLTSSSVTEITYRITVYVELHIHQVFIQPYAPELYIKPSSKKEYPRLCFIVIKKKKKSRPQQYCKLEEGTFPPPPKHQNQNQITYVQQQLIQAIAVLLKKYFHSGRSGNNSLPWKAFNQNAWYH